MAFYASISLFANSGLQTMPESAEIFALALDCGLISELPSAGWDARLVSSIARTFQSDWAVQQNGLVFCPDSLGVSRDLVIDSYDHELELDGVAVSFHGNGYFFPYTPRAIAETFVAQHEVKSFSTQLAERYGGLYRRPRWKRSPLLKTNVFPLPGGWALIGSESL